MERITLRSDGFYETPSGLFAVVPRARSGGNDKTEWFEFKASVLGDVIRVEWATGDPLIVIDAAVARSMLGARYALPPTDELAAEFNDAVDAYNKAHPEPQGEPKAPEPVQETQNEPKGADGAPSSPSGDDISSLRARYEEVLGKKPFMGWGANELQKRIDEAEQAK